MIYVWIDVLSNYIIGLGYNLDSNSDVMKDFWLVDLYLIGKDIMCFYVVYWLVLLLVLGLLLFKKIFGYLWVLVDKNKMSKFVGNMFYIDNLVKYFGVDVLRYYVLYEIFFVVDGNIIYELMIERNNLDLVNILGNLVNCIIGMVNKY